MVKTYKYNDSTQITEHFNAHEFKCKCGQPHDFQLADELVDKLEQLRTALNAKSIVINSGYRCSQHDRNVGGSGTGQHTLGNAADICCIGQDGHPISSKLVCCTAQDIGFTGIANIDDSYTYTHVDVRSGSKWYGNEVVTTAYSVTTDFYAYYGLGDSSIRELQKLLNDKGASLTVDGIAGIKTLAECHKYTINTGEKGPLTKWVQERLNALGYNCGTPDGIAGAKTMTAIHYFQQANRLGVGYLGGSDWDKLVG